MVKDNKAIAFGSTSDRFNNKGLHPNLGLTNEYSTVAPGEHQKLEEWDKKKIPGAKWARSEVKEEMKFKLQLNFNDIFKSDKLSNSAKPNINGNAENGAIQKKQKSHPLASKWQSKDTFSTPGPGFYGKGHKPAQKLEDWSKNRKFSGNFPKAKSSRYPEYLVAPSWKMTPAQYVVKDPGSIQALLDRRISAKGPYQLFSGERDETTLTGFFAVPKFKGSATMFYELPSEMNRLSNPSKHYFGRWIELTDQEILLRMKKSRCEAKPTQRHLIGNVSFVQRDPSEPGPAHYYPRNVHKIKYGLNPPFSHRDKSERGMACFKNTPGVARYFPMDVSYVNGHQSVFQSGTSRIQSQVMR